MAQNKTQQKQTKPTKRKTTDTVKQRAAKKSITLITRNPKCSNMPTASAPVSPDMRAAYFEIGLKLLTPEQLVQLYDYHRMREERAQARALKQAS